MELYDRRIQLYPLTWVKADEVDGGWPAPKKHHFCGFEQERHVLDFKGKIDYTELANQMRVFDAIQKRPDINYLSIYYYDLLTCVPWTQKLEELLNLNDRSWTVELSWPVLHYPYDKPKSKLKRALSVLRNIEYLHLANNDPLSDDQKIKFFRALPPFNALKRFHISCQCNDEQLKFLFQEASFASKISGTRLKPLPLRLGYRTGPIVSSETAMHIHTTTLMHIDSQLVTAVMKMPSLKTLHICMSDDMREMIRLFRWLKDPNCPVTGLSFQFICQPQHWFLILAVLAKIPELETVHLQFSIRIRRLRGFFRALLRAPVIESVTLQAEHFHERFLDSTFEFQCRDKPLEFTMGSKTPANGPGLEKIHFTSWIYRTRRRFEHSKRLDSSLPLSTWANVLERLNVAFDCTSTDVHAVCVETTFNILQELLGDPLRYVDPSELHSASGVSCSNNSIAARVRAKRRKRW